MGAQTGIEWCDATWNPVRGCTRVSEGCRHCYAEAMAARFNKPGQWGEGLAEMTAGGPRWTGRVELVESQLDLPLRWRKPRRIFVNSTSDLFHDGLPEAAIDRVFAVMALAPWHTFLVLTKRPERMLAHFRPDRIGMLADAIVARRTDKVAVGPLPHLDEGERWFPLANVWLGVSVEDQATANERIPLLLATSAAKRFISAEPLLGPADVTRWLTCEGCGTRSQKALKPPAFSCCPDRSGVLDWVICGGESGANARPMHPDWPRGLRDQCFAVGVPFFFKQWGMWGAAPGHPYRFFVCRDGSTDLPDGRGHDVDAGEVEMAPLGNHRTGHLLDGRAWREAPA